MSVNLLRASSQDAVKMQVWGVAKIQNFNTKYWISVNHTPVFCFTTYFTPITAEP